MQTTTTFSLTFEENGTACRQSRACVCDIANWPYRPDEATSPRRATTPPDNAALKESAACPCKPSPEIEDDGPWLEALYKLSECDRLSEIASFGTDQA